MTIDKLLYAAAYSRSDLEKAVLDVPDAELRPLLIESVVRLEEANPAFT